MAPCSLAWPSLAWRDSLHPSFDAHSLFGAHLAYVLRIRQKGSGGVLNLQSQNRLRCFGLSVTGLLRFYSTALREE
jgi:hypothetical protein